jgi:hypothetical protein
MNQEIVYIVYKNSTSVQQGKKHNKTNYKPKNMFEGINGATVTY